MALRKVEAQELPLSFGIDRGTSDVEPLYLFPGQDRVERTFSLALSIEREGYNVYVSGPESIGRTTYTLRRLREKAKEKPVPEDVCYYHNFEKPLNPKHLLLPSGVGRRLVRDIDGVIEDLKQRSHKVFESKEYEEEKVKRIERIEKEKERVLSELSREASERGLSVVITPAGIRLLPSVGGRVVDEVELSQNPVLKESYERNLREFEERFRDYLRELRELDHRLADELKELRERSARNLVEGLVQRLKERYRDIPGVVDYLSELEENIVSNIQFFVEWKFVEENIPLRRLVENNLNLFRLNLVVDNSGLEGAPVIYEETPTVRSVFGYISYRAEMGILYADHSSIVAGSLLRSRGGYIVLRVLDLLKNPILWDLLKRALLHKKVYMSAFPLEAFPLYVGIDPEPVPYEGKVFLIGDYLTYYLLSSLDPEFNRLFKLKAEFNPAIDVDEDLVKSFPSILKAIVLEEGLKELTSDAVEETLRYAIRLSGNRKKMSVVFGYITDILREADSFAQSDEIKGEDVKRAIEEKVFRSNLIEEKIRELIREGELIIETEGRRVGQVNGLSVYDLGDYSFGKPSRITATAYAGEKGIVDIEREVELSGPIHSKGVMILSGYLGNRYGKLVPLSLSCTITFEQLYDEVEGDSATIAELLAVLSAISGIPVRQDIALTGSLDQLGNIQPVGGVREKVEGFWKVCREMGLTGSQGVVIPERNKDNLILDDGLVEDVKKGRFHIYTARHVDDILELLTGVRAESFHRKVLSKLRAFSKRAAPKKGR